MMRPVPDFIHYESGFCTDPAPDVRMLSIFESWSESGIYQASPGPCPCRILSVSSPGPDFIKHVRVHVRILPTPGQEAILVMCMSFEQISIATSHGGSI